MLIVLLLLCILFFSTLELNEFQVWTWMGEIIVTCFLTPYHCFQVPYDLSTASLCSHPDEFPYCSQCVILVVFFKCNNFVLTSRPLHLYTGPSICIILPVLCLTNSIHPANLNLHVHFKESFYDSLI